MSRKINMIRCDGDTVQVPRPTPDHLLRAVCDFDADYDCSVMVDTFVLCAYANAAGQHCYLYVHDHFDNPAANCYYSGSGIFAYELALEQVNQ